LSSAGSFSDSIDRFIPQRFHFALEQHIRHLASKELQLAMGLSTPCSG